MKLIPVLAALALAVATAAPAAAGPAVADPVPTMIVAEVSPATAVPAGAGHTITGTVLARTDDGWAPVTTGGQVAASLCSSRVGGVETCNWGSGSGALTGGAFTITTTPAMTGYYRLRFTPSGGDLQAASLTLAESVVLQRTITGAPHTRTGPSGPILEGAMFFDIARIPLLPAGPTLRLEFSETGADWTTAATALTQKVHQGGFIYYAYLDAIPSGWWRAVYDGTPDFYAASTSAAVHLP
ncbi:MULTISPECIES: hypothetical protein [Actinosynnema]|uniref:hypothetical protein n=1 Tax=Actinosynnema TaxID=40566 RepID=UPI0020A459EB|nr:hypothetical protein [Actinosynnema pretiosum]MCP2097252.1 hypothetical protein [Actinosynnema pretiosum]